MITQDQVTQVNATVLTLASEWSKNKQQLATWTTFNNAALNQVFKVIFDAVDKLVNLVEKYDIPGVDKKKLVIDGINHLVDTLINSQLPLVFVPFESIIDSMVNAVIDNLIEYAVSKIPVSAPAPVTPTTSVGR